MRMPTPNQKNTGDYQENEEFKTTYIASNWLPSALIAEEINTTVSDIRIQEYKHCLLYTSRFFFKIIFIIHFDGMAHALHAVIQVFLERFLQLLFISF